MLNEHQATLRENDIAHATAALYQQLAAAVRGERTYASERENRHYCLFSGLA